MDKITVKARKKAGGAVHFLVFQNYVKNNIKNYKILWICKKTVQFCNIAILYIICKKT